jgi:hypothetical protein
VKVWRFRGDGLAADHGAAEGESVLMSLIDILCRFPLLLFIFSIIFAILYAKYGGK